MKDPEFTEFEEGERQALLQARSFIAQHGTKEVDQYCAQRLHDISMDAKDRQRRLAEVPRLKPGEVRLGPGQLNFAPAAKENKA